ncbi:MAG: type II secretion system F family protein [Thermodesulfovibrionales bacterium]|nr:type II secretion system F family protein [Thermodesulfovibrionales bacterium]
MAIFSYKATSIQGAVVEGFIEASDEKAAIEKIRNSGYIPIRISLSKEDVSRGFSLKSKRGNLIIFTTELSSLLSAGLPLDRSLNILSEISEDKYMKRIIQSILKSIREGSSFSEALQKHPDIFPRIYINMIKAGEAGGVLNVVLDKLNEYLESSKELKDHIFSAMIYPTILLFTGGISIIILLTYVLPKFSVIFSEIGTSLPLPTKILLSISNFLQSFWWLIFGLIFSGLILLKLYVKKPSGRYKWDSLKLKLFRDIIIKLETARFCRTLGTLLKSGVPLLQALNNSKEVINNQLISSTIDIVSKGAKEGQGVFVPLQKAKVFPDLALSMIKVGEETGQLDEMLIKVATTYEKSLRITIKRFISLLEPFLILFMGLIIGFIVLAMLMAIFSITEIPF